MDPHNELRKGRAGAAQSPGGWMFVMQNVVLVEELGAGGTPTAPGCALPQKGFLQNQHSMLVLFCFLFYYKQKSSDFFQFLDIGANVGLSQR